jgi:hypothetical protein
MKYLEIEGWSDYNDQGELLNELLKQSPTKLTIMEIGVFKGRMTMMWNEILELNNIEYDYYAVDHFNGSDFNNPTWENFYETTLKNLKPILNKINLINNNSELEYINYKDEFFDIIYIDASHDYESIKRDIKLWYPKVKQNGFICGDDYINGWPGVIKAVNESFNKINKVGKQQWYYKKV